MWEWIPILDTIHAIRVTLFNWYTLSFSVGLIVGVGVGKWSAWR